MQRKIPRSSRFRSAEDYDKLQQDTPRGEKARLDAKYSIARMAAIFSPVLGIEISEKNPSLPTPQHGQ